MDCADIQELLSEYIDGTLDEKNIQAVEKHVLTCSDCKETLVSLRAMIKELNALESIKAPTDFLEKIHQRMESRSYFDRLFKKLFVPFNIKIPLQLTAAAAVSIIAILVLNIQQSEYQNISAPKTAKSQWSIEKPEADHITPEFKMKTKAAAPAFEETPENLSNIPQAFSLQKSRENTSPRTHALMKPRPSSSVSSKAGPSAEKDQPIVLVFALKPVSADDDHTSDMSTSTTPSAGADKKIMEKNDKDLQKRKIKAEQETRVDNLIGRMERILQPLKGRILTQKYHQKNGRLTAILVQISAKNYEPFYKELNRLGFFKTPPPTLSDKNLKTVTLLIKFTYPE